MQWEYAVVTAEVINKETLDKMDKLGEDGWELVSHATSNHHQGMTRFHHFTFKRQKESAVG